MPALRASQLACIFDDGVTLFRDVNLSLVAARTGLVGRNGVGKSILGAMLAGERTPSAGVVHRGGTVSRFRQQATLARIDRHTRIVDGLGVGRAWDALLAIEAGSASPSHFEALADRWTLREDVQQRLASQGLAHPPDGPLGALSGGERARLRIAWLLAEAPDVLILDEPSNHLDRRGRDWLREVLSDFAGQVLLISHDRALLREVSETWELDTRGLQVYGGNVDNWQQHKAQTLEAIERQLTAARSEAAAQQQRARQADERAARRASRGRRQRADGSQPKLLMDGKKERAAATASARLRAEASRREDLSRHIGALRERREELTDQYLRFQRVPIGGRRHLVHLLDAVLPYGTAVPLRLDLHTGDKRVLHGANGSGKSTLFRVLLGELSLLRGECRVNGQVVCLDQHFGMLDAASTALAQLQRADPELDEAAARTLLAGIGLAGDTVHRRVEALSGGEKMKLCLLIVARRPALPLLLLDEPDNHLDLDAKVRLAAEIRDYAGAVLLVSHDADFVDDCGVSEAFELAGGSGS